MALGTVVVLHEAARRKGHRGAEKRRDHGLPRLLAAGDHPLAGEHPRLECLQAALVGQRIPVWYGPEGEVVASKESPGAGFEQDPDVFDTWFSSSLWPIATLGWPDEDAEDLRYFYPTDLLSTAREIMYLWVARMIMMGLHFESKIPFHKVNVHSIVLAEDGTKMSRSKGNTIDPLELLTSTEPTPCASASSTSPRPRTSLTPASGPRWAVPSSPSSGTPCASCWPTPRLKKEGELSPSDRWILSEFDRTVRSTTPISRSASSRRRCAGSTLSPGTSLPTGTSR